jgi:hypothetical protein
MRNPDAGDAAPVRRCCRLIISELFAWRLSGLDRGGRGGGGRCSSAFVDPGLAKHTDCAALLTEAKADGVHAGPVAAAH